jgi:hypothetical protein
MRTEAFIRKVSRLNAPDGGGSRGGRLGPDRGCSDRGHGPPPLPLRWGNAGGLLFDIGKRGCQPSPYTESPGSGS